MIYLLRILLVSLLIYLVFKSLRGSRSAEEPVISGKGNSKKSKVPDDLGEYIDYEEIKD